jgi:hypothetical protein
MDGTKLEWMLVFDRVICAVPDASRAGSLVETVGGAGANAGDDKDPGGLDRRLR